MFKQIIQITCILLITSFLMQSYAQVISTDTIHFKSSFKETKIQVSRDKKDILLGIPLNLENTKSERFGNVLLAVSIDQQKTTMPLSAFSVLTSPTPLNQLIQSSQFILKINKEASPDRSRVIVLKLEYSFKDKTEDQLLINDAKDINQNITINVNEFNEDSLINGYKYLGYIGTNFDLVDGVKLKNLFLAINTFITSETNRVGGYVSIYGNRTLTSTDTSGKREIITFKKLNDTTYSRIRSNATLIRSRYFDNLGACFNPLVRLYRGRDSKIQIYAAPQLEFIWRRGQVKSEWKDFERLDSTTVTENVLLTPTANTQSTYNYSQFDFHYGLGLAAVHETDQISVRLFMALTVHRSYIPVYENLITMQAKYGTMPTDFSFIGRLWITEPRSGVSVHAEIFNNLINPQPYYGVTLSKAFNFYKLASFFAPITNR